MFMILFQVPKKETRPILMYCSLPAEKRMMLQNMSGFSWKKSVKLLKRLTTANSVIQKKLMLKLKSR